jgi:hypothetical protein
MSHYHHGWWTRSQPESFFLVFDKIMSKQHVKLMCHTVTYYVTFDPHHIEEWLTQAVKRYNPDYEDKQYVHS